MLKKDFQIFLESDCLDEFKIPKNIQYVTNDIAFINSLTDSLKVFYRYIKYILDTSVLYMVDPIIRKGFKDFLKVEELVSGSNSKSLIYDPINKVFRCIEEDYDYEKIEKNISLLEKRIKDIEER